MGQLGFFDLSRRYEGLDVKDAPLVAITAMIRASGEDVARKSPAGRKPWDEVVIFKGAAGALQSFGRSGGRPASRPPHGD
jgi:hypothetical protein